MKKIVGYLASILAILTGVVLTYAAMIQTSSATGVSIVELSFWRIFSLDGILTHSPLLFLSGVALAIAGGALYTFLRRRAIQVN